MVPQQHSGVALYVSEDGTGQILRDVAEPEPEAGEIQVEVLYSGCNPADLKHAHLGINSTVMGYDFMGKVSQVGPNSRYSVGEPVAGYTPTGIGRPGKYGAHQPYLVAPEDHVWRVPENVPPAHAAALTVVVATAADALYNAFGYPFPGETAPEGRKAGPLLVWGASTSVGLAMVQFARASVARPIFAAASPQRHDLLTTLGATKCFNYADADAVSQVRAAVEEERVGPILHAADCTGYPEAAEKVAEIASEQAILVSMRIQQDKRFKLPFGNKARDMTISSPSIGRITLPAQPQEQARMWKGLEWAVQNYGSGFSMPEVEIFEGSAEEALDKVKVVLEGVNFGKLALKHPLK